MANETHGLLNPGEESKKLHQLYVALIDGKIEPSTDQQKKTMMQLLNTKITVLDQKTNRDKIPALCASYFCNAVVWNSNCYFRVEVQ